jgi:hypothetical protein
MIGPPLGLQRAHAYNLTVVVNGDNLRVVSPHQPPDDIVAALRRDKAEIVSYLKVALAVPLDPAITPAHLIAENWRQRFADLDPAVDACPGFRAGEWSAIYGVVASFLQPATAFARVAAEAGWTALELLGVHREAGAMRMETRGALLAAVQGEPVTAVDGMRLTFRNGLAGRRVAMDVAICVPIWDFEGAAS